MRRHLAIHLGGALAAAVIATVTPVVTIALLGHGWAQLLVGFALAVPVLLVTFSSKILRWIRSPVAFRIPLTIGQQRSLPSIHHQRTRSPHSAGQVLLRVLLDTVLFRPLTRTTPSARALSQALDHGTTRSLWLAAMLFHGSLAVILVRHLRILLDPVPGFVAWLENVDVVGDMTLPKLHLSTVVFMLALFYLLGRRLWLAKLRYISIAADYFPLFLLMALATTGLVMRHIVHTDVPALKNLATGLANGALVMPSQDDAFLLVHLFLLGELLVYFPLSKLMHMPGVWLSPTLTLANNTRQSRHVNPNNPKVETLHYADYENAFRGPMIEAGLPVEKE